MSKGPVIENPASNAAVATFINIGERTNVTGSAKFKNLILDELRKQKIWR